MISAAMRRDRFFTILRFLHCADNLQPDLTDKMWKLRPLIKLLNANYMKHYRGQCDLSYDEAMVAYFGHHGCKQYIRGKPIRFGYKLWCLNTADSYLISFDVYQGKMPDSNPGHENLYGKCAAPLLNFIDNIPVKYAVRQLSFYFDNLFTSIDLLMYLRSMGFNATGTVRENRLPKNIPIQTTKCMKKRERGTIDTAICATEQVCVSRWRDNAVVTVASTQHTNMPVTQVRRWSQAEKRHIQVPRPACVSSYNKNMGGVDLMDQGINSYRISIRTKKWWWPLFSWMVDATLHNAWYISRKAGMQMSQKDFRRTIAMAYLKSFATDAKIGGRPSSSATTRISADFVR